MVEHDEMNAPEPVFRRFHVQPEAEMRSRRERWSAKGRARVVHPSRGAVTVPCSSKFTALLNAAEIWGCCWMDLRSAEVLEAESDGQTVRRY